MIIFKLLSSAFSEYSVKTPTEFSINLESFKQVMRRVKPNDTIVLEKEKENKLKVVLKGDSTRTFNLSLLGSEENEQKVPSLEFPLSVIISSEALNDAVEDGSIIGDSIALSVDKEIFVVASEGTTSEAIVELPKGGSTRITNSSGKNIRAKYSVEYLKKMSKASKLSEEVKIEFSEDYPLRLEYLVKDKIHLQFILAPRVAND